MRKNEARKDRGSYRIAICGMAMAMSALVMLIGHSLSFGEYFWYFVAALFIDLPEKRMDKGLCCLGAVLLSGIACGFNFVYLASFVLLFAPYPVVKALLSPLPGLPRYMLMSLFWWGGLLGIMWLTPMFFLQLSLVEDTALQFGASMGLIAVSLVIEPLYRLLHQFGKKILLKVMFDSK